VLAVFRAHGRLIDWGDAFAVPFGLTSARWQMLGALALSGAPASAPTIARQMGVTRQGASKQLALLEQEGLVCKRPNPAHKRSPLFTLTEEGSNRYHALQAAWTDHAQRVCAQIPAAELEITLKTLQALSDLHQSSDEDTDHVD
jgi:DNA-binding MarR family transcriptional regulator